MSFIDREDAGRRLAERLGRYRGDAKALVVALPRGGVSVGRVVADGLGLPLDIVVPRKIGAQSNREYAIGAITEEGHVVWNEAERSKTDPDYLNQAVLEEQAEAKRRLVRFRGDRPPRDWHGRTVIVVDDGIATGFTMLAALKTVRSFRPARVVVAVPTAPPDVEQVLAGQADELIVLEKPTLFRAVGAQYRDFGQVSDNQVVELLERKSTRPSSG